MALEKFSPLKSNISTSADANLIRLGDMNYLVDKANSEINSLQSQVDTLNAAIVAYTKSAFISVWDTTKTSSVEASADNQVKLPLIESGNYFFTVDWGDGKTNTITSYDQAEITHTYNTSGIYTVTISGMCEGWNFNYDNDANTGGFDRLKLLEVTQWGCLKITTSSCFLGCYNLDLANVSDALDISGTTDLRGMFQDCPGLTSINNINLWDVSHVTRFVAMFEQSYSGPNYNFNADFSTWDVSNATDFTLMFANCRAINFDASSWYPKNATTMASMFYRCYGFSTTNYDALLNGWSQKDPLPSNITFTGPPVNYTNAAVDARNLLINTWGWTISDGGLLP